VSGIVAYTPKCPRIRTDRSASRTSRGRCLLPSIKDPRAAQHSLPLLAIVAGSGPVAVAGKTVLFGDNKCVQSDETQAKKFARAGAAGQFNCFPRVGHRELGVGRVEEGTIGPTISADLRVTFDGLRDKMRQEFFCTDIGCGGRWFDYERSGWPRNVDSAKGIGDAPGHDPAYPRDDHGTFAQCAIRIDRQRFLNKRRTHTCDLTIGGRRHNGSDRGVVLVMSRQVGEFGDADGFVR